MWLQRNVIPQLLMVVTNAIFSGPPSCTHYCIVQYLFNWPLINMISITWKWLCIAGYNVCLLTQSKPSRVASKVTAKTSSHTPTGKFLSRSWLEKNSWIVTALKCSWTITWVIVTKGWSFTWKCCLQKGALPTQGFITALHKRKNTVDIEHF